MAELELVADTPNVAVRRHGDQIDAWRVEIDAFYGVMQTFPNMEPDEIFEKLSGFSARVSEMRTRLVRSETRRSSHFRTQEVDFFLSECDRQFKLWSRSQACREFDLRMTTGAPA